MNRSTAFWDKVAERYSNQPIADEAAYQKKLQVTQEYLKPEMEVLEFGCGTGSTAIIHAPFVHHIRAIDFSSKMLDIARAKAESAEIENLTFEKATIEDLEVAEGTLDVVLGLSILHLLEDKEAAISKAFTMLKPGGVFVSSTACLADFMNWFKFVAPLAGVLGLIPQVKVISEQELIESLTNAGFQIDYRWTPGKGKAVFIVAKKPE
ncbi:MAG: methyltransferase domain-containing protein [Cyanobacteria bacterium P01_E01_bin.34]